MGDKVKVTGITCSRRVQKAFTGYIVGYTEHTVWIVEGDIFGKKENLRVYSKRSNNVTLVEAACYRK